MLEKILIDCLGGYGFPARFFFWRRILLRRMLAVLNISRRYHS